MAIVLENYEDFEKFEYDINNQEVLISYEQVETIEILLERATCSYEKIELIRSQFKNYSESEANETILYLKERQVNSIQAGNNYSQKEISKHIKNIIQ
jgi:hypothetical protein